MIVTAWNNGSHHPSGAGYGVKIAISDRDRYFKPDWDHVILELDGGSTSVIINIDKKSFWGVTCRELISKEIGGWLIRKGLAHWQKGKPPKLVLDNKEGNRFFLSSSITRKVSV